MYLAPAVCTSTLYSLLFVTITSGYLLLFNYCILKGLCHKLAISQGLNVFFYCKVSIALFELFGNLTVSYVCVSYSRCVHLIYVFGSAYSRLEKLERRLSQSVYFLQLNSIGRSIKTGFDRVYDCTEIRILFSSNCVII